MNTTTHIPISHPPAAPAGPRALQAPAGVVDVTRIAAYSDAGVRDVCGDCGGERVHHGVLDTGAEILSSVRCSRCAGTGMAAPDATQVRNLYSRYSPHMTPEERTVMALAVKVIARHELPETLPAGGGQ